jgi:hypothetical protein
MKYTIKYQYATYCGTEEIIAGDPDEAIAKMWRRLERWLTIPMACRSAKVVKEEEEES